MDHSTLRFSGLFLLRLAALLCWLLTLSCGISTPPVELQGSRSDNEVRASPPGKRAADPRLAAIPSVSKKPIASPPSTSEEAKPEPITPQSNATPDEEDRVEVVLTFDDGPHAGDLVRGKNYTDSVFRTLKDNLLQKDIKAAFFVQTHAPARGATQTGQYLIARLAREGHVIGIHTGSTADHANHCTRAAASPYDVNRNGYLETGDGANALESDMIRAKARIQRLTGSVPLYVRPTYGERNRTVKAVYEQQNLKMILWDIVSGDSTGSPSVDDVNRNIDEGMEQCIAAGKEQIVILFHDINSKTALNLEEYLGNICISARKFRKTVIFPTTTERVLQILNARSDQ